MTPASGRRSRGAAGLVAAPLAVVVAILLLAGAACSGDDAGGTAPSIDFEFSGDAATVNGEAIPASILADTLAVFRASPAALRPAFQVDSLDQPGSDQPDPVIVANLLTTEISLRVIDDEFDRRALSITPAAQAIGQSQVRAVFEDSLATQPAYETELADRLARYIVLDQALVGISDDELRATYERDPGQYDQACAAHILVATEAEANDLLAQLRAGADFAQLAREHSTDPVSAANGGELGCQRRGVYVAPFEDAVWNGPIGTVQGPIGTDYGYHLIKVASRGPRTFDEAIDDVRVDMSPDTFSKLSEWRQQALAEATVTVDPRFGTWDPASGTVTPLGVSGGTLQIQGEPDPTDVTTPDSSPVTTGAGAGTPATTAAAAVATTGPARS